MCLLIGRILRLSPWQYPSIHPGLVSFLFTITIFPLLYRKIFHLLNPRRTCAGGLRYLSCVCVCLCVCAPAPTTLVSTLKMRYVGVYLRLFLLFYVWIFDKSFLSKVMARKSQYANEQLPLRPVLACFEYRAYISRYLRYLSA